MRAYLTTAKDYTQTDFKMATYCTSQNNIALTRKLVPLLSHIFLLFPFRTYHFQSPFSHILWHALQCCSIFTKLFVPRQMTCSLILFLSRLKRHKALKPAGQSIQKRAVGSVNKLTSQSIIIIQPLLMANLNVFSRRSRRVGNCVCCHWLLRLKHNTSQQLITWRALKVKLTRTQWNRMRGQCFGRRYPKYHPSPKWKLQFYPMTSH